MQLKTVLFTVAALAAGCQPLEAARQVQASQSVALWSESQGRPQLLVGRLDAPGATQEEAARTVLTANARAWHLDDPSLSLQLAATKHGLAGDYLRFEQWHRGLPVFTGDVVVLVTAQAPWAVLAVNLSHREEVARVTATAELSAARAQALGLAHVAAVAPYREEPAAVLGVYVPDERRGPKSAPVAGAAPALAYRVRVSTEKPVHDWEVFVDAVSGQVLATRDRVVYVDGTGQVFDANPVASTGNTTLRDNNDATSATLDGARYQVTLPRLDSSGFTRGTYVDSRSANAASRVQSSTYTFNYTRDQSPMFEQVNVYFHIDRVQQRIQSLGITNAGNGAQLAIVDAQNSDNSYFSGSTINYGKGGVDDAEDGDIVVHEYGHALQNDQVSGWGGGDEGSMGEGFGDYLAGSMELALGLADGHATLADPACVGDWDATAYSTARPPCLRRLDSAKHYPEAETGEVHDDGEMWSAALWGLRAQLGPDITDRLVIESHFLLGRSASFFTASQALVTVDTNLYAGAHDATIRRRMIRHGMSRALTAVDAGAPIASLAVSIDNPRDSSGNYASSLDDTQTYTVPGATALSVHFARITVEANNQCLARSCDNVYLTNADGDLFQVLGTTTGVSSSPIAGDTVNIRLVTDSNTNNFGYHVDRIDVLGVVDGGVIDGGGLIDAGTTTDAGTTDAGRPDGGVADGGGSDAGLPDAGAGDAGGEVDGGNPTPIPPDAALGKAAPTGCGCTTGSELWAGLLALAGLLRRRRG